MGVVGDVYGPAPRVRELAGAAASRLVSSDPGLSRLRYALGVVASVGVAVGVIFLTLHPTPQVVLLGASAAMVSSSQRFDATRLKRVAVIALLFAPAAFSLTVATLLAERKIIADLVFLAVIFAALCLFGIKLFGQPVGTVAFMMFFFALFIRAKSSELPELYLALAIAITATAVVTGVLSRSTAVPMLGFVRRSYRARLAQALSAAVQLLEAPQPTRADTKRLQRRVTRLHDAALAIEGELASVADGAAADLRRRILGSELAVQRLAGEIGELVRAAAPLAERRPVADQLVELREWIVSGTPAPPQRLAAESVWLDAGPAGPARSTMWAIAEVVDAIELARRPAEDVDLSAYTPPTEPPERTAAEKLPPTVRRAIQATVGCGLAIVAGELLSDQRWYWAVITAFMTFVGTSSAGQTLVKGFRRVVGTLIGVVAGTVVASLLAGHLGLVVAVTFLCVFAGFYALSLSYGLMTFFITVMLGMLYSLLGTFTPELLLLRLEETAIGALAGMAAAVLVVPTTATSAAREATAKVLDRIHQFVGDAVAVLADGDSINLIDAARDIDADLADLHGVAEPIVHRASPLRARRSDTRLSLALLDSAAYHVRAMAANAEVAALAGDDGLVATAGRMRDNLRLLVDSLRADYGQPDRPLRRGASPSSKAGGGARLDERTTRLLDHLDRLDATVTGLARPLGIRIE
ncbi:FUSC family protein [Fodinicola acaciae]|uniref:FUSC family protein n=1 Tax=Fodinicola acaciae TaxID=2681555 RepID=UPI0013D6BC9B|nr:FUSC family protein [Fodinicola acaciae]